MKLQAVSFVETVFAKVKKKRVKKMRHPNSPLYKAIWPMIYIVRMFGFAPFDFSQDRLRLSNINFIFTAITATFYNYVLYEILAKFFNIPRETWTLRATENAKVIINYIIAMYELGLAAFTRRRFIKIWNGLQDYDKSIKQLGYPRKETRTTIVAWILATVMAVIWIYINRIGMIAFGETWTINMKYLMPYVGTSVALYKFVAITIFLGQRFRHLNSIAIKNLPSMEGNEATLSKKTILSLHNELMIIAEDWESLYSLSLLFWVCSLSLHTTSNLYFVIEWVLSYEMNVGSWLVVSCMSSWTLAFLFQLLLLHITCDFTLSQANSLDPILIEWQARLMKKNDDIEYALQFLNRRLKFSAGGCFYVDLPSLCSIFSLMTTYLAVLLQLK